MGESLSSLIRQKIPDAAGQYYRLIVLVGAAGSGKTAALRDVHEQTGAPLINVNLDVSQRMLDLTESQRQRHVTSILEDIVRQAAPPEYPVVLLDNIELLFDHALQIDPLRLLQQISRNTTLVVAWPGTIHDGHLTYAVAGHPENQRYPADDLILVTHDV
ncbi:BREX-3 system P-loop-containing protein BrxF [bacterium]|nr:BREX-3 system P-loop-containing protein BrxF [candidate division CSSED10-310 bacterium]